mmetsp:Transcript_10510/g.25757  ORF Transcript_10510/g.25757 Transcript_10510/m.25757 type:complete len:286 (+) Transcript_10510:958-1815(+)
MTPSTTFCHSAFSVSASFPPADNRSRTNAAPCSFPFFTAFAALHIRVNSSEDDCPPWLFKSVGGPRMLTSAPFLTRSFANPSSASPQLTASAAHHSGVQRPTSKSLPSPTPLTSAPLCIRTLAKSRQSIMPEASSDLWIDILHHIAYAIHHSGVLSLPSAFPTALTSAPISTRNLASSVPPGLSNISFAAIQSGVPSLEYFSITMSTFAPFLMRRFANSTPPSVSSVNTAMYHSGALTFAPFSTRSVASSSPPTAPLDTAVSAYSNGVPWTPSIYESIRLALTSA